MSLTYVTTETGYTILKDGVVWIVQDGFFPFPSETIEQSAQAHINDILTNSQSGTNISDEIEALKAQNAQMLLALVEGGLM